CAPPPPGSPWSSGDTTGIAAVGRVAGGVPLAGAPLLLPAPAASAMAACRSAALSPMSVGSVAWLATCVDASIPDVAVTAPSPLAAAVSESAWVAEQKTHTSETLGICLPQATHVFFSDIRPGRVYPTFR